MVLRKAVWNAFELYGEIKTLQGLLGLNNFVMIVAESDECDQHSSGGDVLGEL